MTTRPLLALSLSLAACASSPHAPFTVEDARPNDAPDAADVREAIDVKVMRPDVAAPRDVSDVSEAIDVARDARVEDFLDVTGPEDLAAPRPLAPESTGFVASRRPELRWALGGRFDGAEAELCADRACNRVLTTLRGTSSARPTADLPPGPVFWRLRGARGAVTASETSATWMFVVGARSASAGTGWGGLLDVNGDGLGDLAVGVPHAMHGRVMVLHGASSGAVPGAELLGDPTGVLYGQSVANAGDLNGDGYADLAVGSTGSSMAGTDTPGEVRVYLGGPTGVSTTAARVLRGASDDEHLGGALAGAGDFDGDGYADLVVSALRISAKALVQVRVYRGGPGGLEATPVRVLSCGELIGTEGISLAGIGDVNGDGAPDLAVGVGHITDTAPGVVTVFLAGSWAASELRGGSNESFGRLVRGAGDVNGDGYSDLLVAAPFTAGAAERAGAVFVYTGAPSGVVSAPFRRIDESAGMAFGFGIAGVADVNADGFSELFVSTGSTNRALLFYGGDPLAGGVAFPTVSGTLGAVAGVGDLDGDGRADVATATEHPDGVGTVTVFRGLGASKPTPSALTVSVGLDVVLAGLR